MKIVLLAGGQSRRMGKDKTFIEMQGQHALSRTHELAHELSMEWYISCQQEQASHYENWAPCIHDHGTDQGPLMGIQTCLEHLQENLLFLGNDMPGINHQVLHELIMAFDQKWTYFKTTERLHPIPSIVPHSYLAEIKALTHQGERSLTQVIKKLNGHAIDQMNYFFQNINTPNDLKSLQHD